MYGPTKLVCRMTIILLNLRASYAAESEPLLCAVKVHRSLPQIERLAFEIRAKDC